MKWVLDGFLEAGGQVYFAYDIGLHLALIAGLPYFLLRRVREPDFLSGWRERLGWLPPTANPHGMTGIWNPSPSERSQGTSTGALSAGDVWTSCRCPLELCAHRDQESCPGARYSAGNDPTSTRLAGRSFAGWSVCVRGAFARSAEHPEVGSARRRHPAMRRVPQLDGDNAQLRHLDADVDSGKSL